MVDKAAKLWPTFKEKQNGRARLKEFVQWLQHEHKITININAEAATKTLKTCLAKHRKRANRGASERPISMDSWDAKTRPTKIF